MSKRTTKFYRANEADVMSALGFIPTKNSGAGWVEKEDGQNEYLIAQLKSTDAESIRIQQKDITILEYNATVAHKIPCFVIQFLNNNDVFVMARPNDLQQVVKYITTGHCERPQIDLSEVSHSIHKVKSTIKSDDNSRKDFWNQKEKEQKKWKQQYKRK
jgi:hypothetical protein